MLGQCTLADVTKDCGSLQDLVYILFSAEGIESVHSVTEYLVQCTS